MPVITIDGGRAPENGFVYFTLRLSEAATDAVTVDYATISGTAARDFDVRYHGSADRLDGTVEFGIGERVKTIAVYVGSESDDELDESFFLELRNPDGATFGNNTHSLTAVGWALDNDGPGLNRAIAVSNAVVSEAAGGKAVFTVSLSQAFDTDRSFSFRTFNDSAKANSDYVAKTGTVTFLAGQTETKVEIDLVNNTLAEATERFGLAITGAHNVIGTTGTALIEDDDSARPVLSIDGGRAPENGFVYFTLRLSEAATDAVTVDYATISGTAARDFDVRYHGSADRLDGTVEFGIGERVKTIAVYVGSESDDELDESFFLELRNPDGATFGGGNNKLVATGWALDDDGPSLNRTVAVSGAEVREGPGGRVAVFAIEISTAHDAPLTLNYQTVNGTALAGQDYTAASGRITFAAGQTRVEITVPIRNDLTPESTEQFYLRVAPPFPSPISASSSIATGTATITDGTLRGTGGNDVLRGTNGADAIAGLGGHDLLIGLAGNDRIWGGGGNDTMQGGGGADRLIGSAGNDVYHIDRLDTVAEAVNGGWDTVYAAFSLALPANVERLVLTGTANINGTGNRLDNVLYGNSGANVLGGGAGNDTYVIGAGDRVIEAAGAGMDTVRSTVTHALSANAENLVLLGGGNINGTGNGLANRLTGNAGANVLGGGAGADTLFGGAGADILGGGADRNRDVFLFNQFSDFGRGGATDRIYGFVSGIDDLNMSALDANSRLGGNQDFVFSGTAARANSVWYAQQGSNLVVRGDHNGDGRADFAFVVHNQRSLSADDFIF